MVKTTVSSDKNPSKESNNQAEKGDSTCDDSPIGEDSKKPSVTSEKLLTPQRTPIESLDLDVDKFDFKDSILENIDQVSEVKSLEKAVDTLDKMGFDIFDSVSGLRKTLYDQ